MSFKKPHSADEQLELARRAKAGDRAAYADLVESQSGLVRKIAVSFAKQSVHVEIDDLIQEGYLAVMDAVRWFDPDRGYNFSTYSGDCIRRRLHRWLQSRQVVPICAQEAISIDGGDNPLESVAGGDAADFAEEVTEALLKLPPLYRCVVCKRRGLTAEAMPAEQVGQWLGLSVQRERDIYRRAYEALTAPV